RRRWSKGRAPAPGRSWSRSRAGWQARRGWAWRWFGFVPAVPREGDLSGRSSHASLESVGLKDGGSCALLAGWISLIQPDSGWAQNQLGGQTRAGAAVLPIVLAVRQGISSLPPTSGQSFIYEFDLNLGAPVRSERLGPISLRTPETIGSG